MEQRPPDETPKRAEENVALPMWFGSAGPSPLGYSSVAYEALLRPAATGAHAQRDASGAAFTPAVQQPSALLHSERFAAEAAVYARGGYRDSLEPHANMQAGADAAEGLMQTAHQLPGATLPPSPLQPQYHHHYQHQQEDLNRADPDEGPVGAVGSPDPDSIPPQQPQLLGSWCLPPRRNPGGLVAADPDGTLVGGPDPDHLAAPNPNCMTSGAQQEQQQQQQQQQLLAAWPQQEGQLQQMSEWNREQPQEQQSPWPAWQQQRLQQRQPYLLLQPLAWMRQAQHPQPQPMQHQQQEGVYQPHQLHHQELQPGQESQPLCPKEQGAQQHLQQSPQRNWPDDVDFVHGDCRDPWVTAASTVAATPVSTTPPTAPRRWAAAANTTVPIPHPHNTAFTSAPLPQPFEAATPPTAAPVSAAMAVAAMAAASAAMGAPPAAAAARLSPICLGRTSAGAVHTGDPTSASGDGGVSDDVGESGGNRTSGGRGCGRRQSALGGLMDAGGREEVSGGGSWTGGGGGDDDTGGGDDGRDDGDGEVGYPGDNDDVDQAMSSSSSSGGDAGGFQRRRYRTVESGGGGHVAGDAGEHVVDDVAGVQADIGGGDGGEGRQGAWEADAGEGGADVDDDARDASSHLDLLSRAGVLAAVERELLGRLEHVQATKASLDELEAALSAEVASLGALLRHAMQQQGQPLHGQQQGQLPQQGQGQRQHVQQQEYPQQQQPPQQEEEGHALYRHQQQQHQQQPEQELQGPQNPVWQALQQQAFAMAAGAAAPAALAPPGLYQGEQQQQQQDDMALGQEQDNDNERLSGQGSYLADAGDADADAGEIGQEQEHRRNAEEADAGEEKGQSGRQSLERSQQQLPPPPSAALLGLLGIGGAAPPPAAASSASSHQQQQQQQPQQLEQPRRQQPLWEQRLQLQQASAAGTAVATSVAYVTATAAVASNAATDEADNDMGDAIAGEQELSKGVATAAAAAGVATAGATSLVTVGAKRPRVPDDEEDGTAGDGTNGGF